MRKKNVGFILQHLRKINIQLKEEKEGNVWHLGCYFIATSSAMPEDQQWLNLQLPKKKKKSSFQDIFAEDE